MTNLGKCLAIKTKKPRKILIISIIYEAYCTRGGELPLPIAIGIGLSRYVILKKENPAPGAAFLFPGLSLEVPSAQSIK
jgi:hypothetical protein